MEASGIGQGQQGQGDGGGQQQGGEGEGTGPDFGAMMQALSQQGETLESLRDFVQSEPWQQMQNAQEGEGGESDDPLGDLDLGYLDPAVAATMDPQQLEQTLRSTIQQAAQQIARQENEPVRQEVAELRRNAEVQQLVGEFPELGEPETAQQVMQASDQLAKQMGQPELAESPAFWRLVFMAGRAADAAQEEADDVPSPVTLESGAGATPGGGGGDAGDLIVNAGAGRGVLPF